MNPLNITEVICVLVSVCNFTRKKAGMFKAFRSVCGLWRNVCSCFFPTPEIDFADKAYFLLNRYKKEDICKEFREVIVKYSLVSEKDMMKFINKTLFPKYITSRPMLEKYISITKISYVMIDMHYLDISLDELKDVCCDHNIKFSVVSIVSNDKVCRENPNIKEWFGSVCDVRSRGCISGSDTGKRRISKYLSDDDVVWIFSIWTFECDFSYFLDNKSDEELVECIEKFTSHQPNFNLLRNASKNTRFRNHLDYSMDIPLDMVVLFRGREVMRRSILDSVGLIRYCEPDPILIRIIHKTSVFSNYRCQSHVFDHLSIDQMNYLAERDVIPVQINMKYTYEEYSLLCPQIQRLCTVNGNGKHINFEDPRAPLEIYRNNFKKSYMSLSQNINLTKEFLNECLTKETFTEVAIVMLLNPLFSIRDLQNVLGI